MEGYRAASILAKIVFVLLIIGFLIHMIGFYTPHWRVWGYATERGGPITRYEGLWNFCKSYFFRFECSQFTSHGSWFEAVQAFETLGFIAALVSLVLVVLYIFVPATSGKKIVFILCMIACFAAAGCIILGIIIYGAKVERNLSWSFALCTIAGIIFGVSGILLIVDMMKR